MPRLKANYFNFTGGLDTDSSILNRNPITVTDIDNCYIGLDGSIESRNGFYMYGFGSGFASTTPYEPVLNAYNHEFKDSTGIYRQYQIIRGANEIKIIEGSGDNLDGGGYSQLITGVFAYNDVIDITFDGDIMFVPSFDGPLLYKFDPSSSIYTIVSSEVIKYRNHISYDASKYANSFFQCGSDTIDIHPLEFSNTIWTSSTPSGTVNEFEFNTSYSSGTDVKVTKGVFTIVISAETTGASEYLYKGNPVKITKETGDVVYDTIHSHYIEGSKYVVITERLSELDEIDTVSFSSPVVRNFTDIARTTELGLGRAFYIFENTPNRVYYSQIYTNELNNITKCYAAANPFDPIDSAVVSSDGGYFDIKGSSYVVGVKESNGGLLIFCKNGVWEAVGTDGIFRADDFTLRKITNKGCVSMYSIETIENGVAYASEDGINYITKDPNSGGLYSIVKSLTDNKIQNYIAAISRGNKEAIRCTYNNVLKELYVLYNEDNNVVDHILEGQPVHYRNILILSLKLQAWFKWSLSSDPDMDKISIADIYMTDFTPAEKDVVISDTGDAVIADDGSEVFASSYNEAVFSKIPIVIVSLYGTSTNAAADQFNFTGYSKMYTSSLFDFEDTIYEEFNEASFSTAHQTYGDLLKGKNSNYLKILYERTEDGTQDVHNYYTNQGGCYLRTSLDMSNNPVAALDAFGQTKNTNVEYGKYFNIYPAYRASSSLVGNQFPGVSHLMYKHKVLGRGSVLQFHFKNKENKRWFKAVQTTQGDSPILDDGTNWEEITEAEFDAGVGFVWGSALTYSKGNLVFVSQATQFKIIGWSCDLISTEGGNN